MKYEKSCGAVICRGDGEKREYLLIKQNAGHWGFPKGHVEAGETEIETALREVKEETGLDVELLEGFRQSISYSPARGVTKEVVFFAARCAGEGMHLQEEEVSAALWLDYDAAMKKSTHDSTKNILFAANEFFNK